MTLIFPISAGLTQPPVVTNVPIVLYVPTHVGGGIGHAKVLHAILIFAGFAPVQSASATVTPSLRLQIVRAICVPHPHDTLQAPYGPDCHVYIVAGVHVVVVPFHVPHILVQKIENFPSTYLFVVR